MIEPISDLHQWLVEKLLEWEYTEVFVVSVRPKKQRGG